MKDADLEKYKSAWKNEQSFNSNILSDADIKNYLKKRSSELTRSLKAGLVIDIVIKAFLAISFVFISCLFSNNYGIIAISVISCISILAMVLFQVFTYRKIPKQKEYSDNIRYFLESKIRFYRERYLKSIYVIAMSNPLIFLSGIMQYFYFKYGEIRPLQYDDFLVFGILAILGFVLGVIIQIKQFSFQINQMETCLSQLDESGINEQLLKKQLNQRKKMILMSILALVLGLLFLFIMLIHR